MSYEDQIRRVYDPQKQLDQDGVLKDHDDEFVFRKDPVDLQVTFQYRLLAELSADTSGTLDTGPVVDVTQYRIATVLWTVSCGFADSDTGILIPQVLLRDVQTRTEGIQTGVTPWAAPAAIDSSLVDDAVIARGYKYREVNPSSFRLAVEGAGGEAVGNITTRTILQFDVTPYEKLRFQNSVVTGGQGLEQGLDLSLSR